MSEAPPVTVENLREDLERLKAKIPGDAPSYIMEMLAFEDAKLDVMEAMDDGILDILEGHEDILQPHTAEKFAVVIAGCQSVIGEISKRLDKKNPRDRELAKALVELAQRCKDAKAILLEIVTVADVSDDPDEGDGDDEDTEPPVTEPKDASHADAAV